MQRAGLITTAAGAGDATKAFDVAAGLSQRLPGFTRGAVSKLPEGDKALLLCRNQGDHLAALVGGELTRRKAG